jgi:nucleotide-binding universal stress UspA family protein
VYSHILIATDGSELAGTAVEHGLALATALNARVTFMTATPDWSATQMAELAERGIADPVLDYETKAAGWARKVLAGCEARATKIGVRAATLHVKDQAAADAIIDTAHNAGCDLIVMASHGRTGVTRMLLGSVALKVLAKCELPVLVCR